MIIDDNCTNSALMISRYQNKLCTYLFFTLICAVAAMMCFGRSRARTAEPATAAPAAVAQQDQKTTGPVSPVQMQHNLIRFLFCF